MLEFSRAAQALRYLVTKMLVAILLKIFAIFKDVSTTFETKL